MDATEAENLRFSFSAAASDAAEEEEEDDYHSLPPSSPAASLRSPSDSFDLFDSGAMDAEMSTYYELEPAPVTEADLVAEWIDDEMRSMRSEVSLEEGSDMSVVDWDPPDLDMLGLDADYSLDEIESILGHGEGDLGGLDWIDTAEFPVFQDSPYNSDSFGECFPPNPNQNQPVMNPEPEPDWDTVSTTSSSIPDLEELVRNMELEVLLAMHNIYEGDPEMEMFRHFLDLDRAGRIGPATSRSALENLPCITADETMARDLQCAVCKEFVVVGELISRLPCLHGYHKSCIVPWLGIRNTCPLCRFELPTDDPSYESWRERERRELLDQV